jgi:hypothetical protein
MCMHKANCIDRMQKHGLIPTQLSFLFSFDIEHKTNRNNR